MPTVPIPNDPTILLSYVNTQLRDFYSSFEDFCIACDLDAAAIAAKLQRIGYTYDPVQNRFR